MFNAEPGMCGRSWGYHMTGDISFNDGIDRQKVRCYRIGDRVGCHFNRIEEVAFFTVNGQTVGEYAKSSVNKIES